MSDGKISSGPGLKEGRGGGCGIENDGPTDSENCQSTGTGTGTGQTAARQTLQVASGYKGRHGRRGKGATSARGMQSGGLGTGDNARL